MILNKIVEKKKIYLENNKRDLNITDREPLDFYTALKNGDISIIAEVKKASPSKGIIREKFNPVEIAQEYLKAEVSAMSVLTETDFFQGSPEFLRDIRKIADIPLLRKDFIIDEYQIFEAFVLGADAILLIMAILDDKTAEKFLSLTKSLGMNCLVEVHDIEEVKRALGIGADIIGINNRNLNTFDEDIHTTERLIKFIPSDKVVISESSIKTFEDIEYLKNLNVNGVLIGETFMRADNICEAVLKMKGL